MAKHHLGAQGIVDVGKFHFVQILQSLRQSLGVVVQQRQVVMQGIKLKFRRQRRVVLLDKLFRPGVFFQFQRQIDDVFKVPGRQGAILHQHTGINAIGVEIKRLRLIVFLHLIDLNVAKIDGILVHIRQILRVKFFGSPEQQGL